MQALLDLLADGFFHSGEELGEKLGISRAAVWKKIKHLEELGLRLDSVRGKGYRLASGIELLDTAKIAAHLKPELVDNVLLHCDPVVRSTNDWVQQCEQENPGRWNICLAECQTSGRGRRGRSWQSPFGSSIYYSMIWHVRQGVASLEGLSLAVGLALVRTVEAFGGKGVQLKWPNDVLWQGRKLAGVLLEISGDPTGECKVVIGMGVNGRLFPEDRQQIDQPVADLHEILPVRASRNEVIARLTNTLIPMLETFGQSGFAAFQQEWSRYDAFVGRQVVLSTATDAICGEALGVEVDGGLKIRTANGIQIFKGGELSLRALL
ncbi:bifunctional biotin--[acetyl-CoA-carboxylase] ligase/biotin operon repressor BirA [Spongorhabdus nitratireducens]